MKNFLSNLKIPAIVSLLVVIPFMLMEIVNRRQFHEGFPIALFVFLWFLPFLFVAIVMPLARDVRSGMDILARPLSLGVKVSLLLLLATMWFGVVIDQMPCFLGVPICD
ncbi:MAG: hypothetical protein HY867_08825 [Chloroflexi bacterium]|nr:hypothetical protein [Chloroflexota bacterium]